MTCFIAGDSIAVDAHMVVRECNWSAKIGISSSAIISRVQDADLVVISAGSNDPTNPQLKANLEAERARAKHDVLWIVPQHPRAARIVREVAREHSDGLITFTPAGDGVHPKYLSPIAKAIRAAMKQ